MHGARPRNAARSAASGPPDRCSSRRAARATRRSSGTTPWYPGSRAPNVWATQIDCTALAERPADGPHATRLPNVDPAVAVDTHTGTLPMLYAATTAGVTQRLLLATRPLTATGAVVGDAGGGSSGLRTSDGGRALCRVAASQRSESP
jgi:hypothetical protein